MARIRTIKPEFFTSEDIVSLSPTARLLYIACWCEADRAGRFEWKPGTLKMRYLPGDDCSVDTLGQELQDRGLMLLYEHDGRMYAVIPTFEKHQVINNREAASELPQPPIDIKSKRPARISPQTREYVMSRDRYECVRCGSADDLTLDHILPQSLGGGHEAENLRVMCRKCNGGRPVAGKALHDDLLSDGYDLQYLLSRVGTRESGVKAEGKEGRKEGKGGRVVPLHGPTPPQTDGEEPREHAGGQDRSEAEHTPVARLPLVDGTEFPVSAEKARKWAESFPAVDVPQQLLAMRAWLDANPRNRKTASGIERFVVGWLTKAQNRAPRQAGAVADEPWAGAI